MLMAPIEPLPIEPLMPRPSYRVVRMLRRWTAGAELGPSRLPSLVALGKRIGIAPMAAVAMASLFQLTESCLGRPLVAECCCHPRLSRDERAILALLAAELPVHPNQAGPSIPHGLPGALIWAVASVRQLLGDPSWPGPKTNRRCPFASE